jgi:hypothetical protein
LFKALQIRHRSQQLIIQPTCQLATSLVEKKLKKKTK